jgi:hypothetical protein
MTSSLTPLLHRNSGIGTAFEVINNKGVKSYLIGTCHNADQNMIVTSYFHEIMDKCSALYNETGPPVFVTPLHYCLKGAQKYSHIQYRYKLDTAIWMAACRMHIPIISLDAGLPAYDLMKVAFKAELSRLGPSEVEKRFLLDAELLNNNPNFIEMHNNIQQGDVTALGALREGTRTKFGDERETHWSEVLIPQLTNTQKPICIAVGALHVFGRDSLSDRFQKAGLTVTLIPPSS